MRHPAACPEQAERLQATSALNIAEAAFVGLVAAGKIKPEDAPKVTNAIGLLRQQVANSATQPVDWSAVLLQITTWTAMWVAAK